MCNVHTTHRAQRQFVQSQAQVRSIVITHVRKPYLVFLGGEQSVSTHYDLSPEVQSVEKSRTICIRHPPPQKKKKKKKKHAYTHTHTHTHACTHKQQNNRPKTKGYLHKTGDVLTRLTESCARQQQRKEKKPKPITDRCFVTGCASRHRVCSAEHDAARDTDWVISYSYYACRSLP